jgi:hypothetical protein
VMALLDDLRFTPGRRSAEDRRWIGSPDRPVLELAPRPGLFARHP